MLTAREIISQCGGATALAEALRRHCPERTLSRDALYNWPNRGVPSFWLVPLQEVLRERGVELSAAELMALAGPRQAA